MNKYWKIAIRDLQRNRRRTLLTMLSVVIGVALLIFINGFYAGILDGSMDMSIKLQSSHLQVRAPSYDEDRVSLQWKDLVQTPEELISQISAIPGVKAVTAVLWANGLLLSGEDTVGVKVNGIEPQSAILEPIRKAVVEGEMIKDDDRTGVMIGKGLADNLGLTVGDNVVLVVNTADQVSDQASFTIRGLFDTGVSQYDDATVYLPLAKAQAISAVGDRASAIRVLLDKQNDADAFAASFSQSGLKVLTWKELNALIMSSIATSNAFLQILYLIVLGVVAVVIANTLLMSVFERTHEIGILSALGMKSRQILSMFLLEAGILGAMGVTLGTIIGGSILVYYSKVGMDIGQSAVQAKASNMITYGKLIYTSFSFSAAAYLAFFALGLILLISLYPARIAARMEPVQALHGD